MIYIEEKKERDGKVEDLKVKGKKKDKDEKDIKMIEKVEKIKEGIRKDLYDDEEKWGGERKE